MLRALYGRYAGERGFRREELAAVLSEVAGKDLGSFLERLVGTAGDLPYDGALAWYGLRLAEGKTRERGEGNDAESAPAPGEKPAWLGVETDAQDGRLMVTQVARNSPGHRAGINAGDELLAIGDYRVPPHGLEGRLKAYRPGEEATLLVARRERLLRIPVVFGDKPRLRTRLEIDPAATAEQRAHLEAWLGGAPAGA